MYLTNFTPRALIGAFSVTIEAEMKDKQALRLIRRLNDGTNIGQMADGKKMA